MHVNEHESINGLQIIRAFRGGWATAHEG